MLAVLSFAVALAAAPAPSGGKHVVVNPSWDRQPTKDELLAAYPTDALVKGVEGQVQIECRVVADETLADCRVVKEDPPGQGFGEAALSVQGVIRMHPKMVDGVATSEGKVVIPLHFKVASPTGGDGAAVYLTESEHCVGLAEAELEADPSTLPDLWLWFNVYVATQTSNGVKPSEWLPKLDAARLAAEPLVSTPAGRDAIQACRKYAEVMIIVNKAKK